MKKRLTLMVSILSLLLSYASGQTVIDGFVYDAETKEAVIGATIFTSQNKGTLTNTSGYFHLKGHGETNIQIRHLGYENLEIAMSLLKQDTTLSIFLKPDQKQLREVQVTETAWQKDLRNSNIVDVPLQQTQNFPVLAGEADPIKYLHSLPGISLGREGRSDLHVRGGSPDQNLMLIDGMPIFSIQHVGGLLSILDPNSLKGIKLYKGGFPARYGGRLSSIVDISLKDGDKSNWKKYIDIGLVSARFAIEGPLKKDKFSLFTSLRRANTDIFSNVISYLNNDGKYRAGYTFYDFIGKVNWRHSNKDQFALTLYGGIDRIYAIGKTDEAIDGTAFDMKVKSQLRWTNFLSVLNWNHLTGKNHFRNIMIGFSQYQLNNSYLSERKVQAADTLFDYSNSRFKGYTREARAGINYEVNLIEEILLQYGVQSSWQQFLPGEFSENQYGASLLSINEKYGSRKSDIFELSTYIESTITLNQFEINPGLRATYWLNMDISPHLEPRLMVSYRYHKHSFNFSAASMRQSLHLLSNNSAGLPVDLWVPSSREIRPMESYNYAIGYARNTSLYLFQLGSYYKTFENVIEFQEGKSFFGDNLDWSDKIENSGLGKSYGFEFLMRKKTGKINGWASYTYSRSLRRFININDNQWFPYRYDRPHNISLFSDFLLRDGISIGANWTYASGDAITLPTSKYPLLTFDEDDYIFANDFFVAYGNSKRNRYRIPATHRLDLNVSFFKKTQNYDRTFRFGVYNVYNRKNPYYVYFDKNKNGQVGLYKAALLPFFPYISWSFKFKN